MFEETFVSILSTRAEWFENPLYAYLEGEELLEQMVEDTRNSIRPFMDAVKARLDANQDMSVDEFQHLLEELKAQF